MKTGAPGGLMRINPRGRVASGDGEGELRETNAIAACFDFSFRACQTLNPDPDAKRFALMKQREFAMKPMGYQVSFKSASEPLSLSLSLLFLFFAREVIASRSLIGTGAALWEYRSRPLPFQSLEGPVYILLAGVRGSADLSDAMATKRGRRGGLFEEDSS